jgi:GrpB-like predicted nucleotidyltransferase (UPF0157 family)
LPATGGSVIGTYEYIRYPDPADAFRPYDPRCAEVAVRVGGLIWERIAQHHSEAVNQWRIEHIGSTAIPGCHGKGPVDLMLLYPPGHLVMARDTLDELGFQRHELPGAFPEERPVRIGTIAHDGTSFRLHVHVLVAGAPEAAEQICFRDILRANSALVAEYVALKQAVLAGGVSSSGEYNDGKDAFIRRVLGTA